MSAKAPVDPIRKYLDTARHQIAVGNLTGAAQTLNDARRRAPRDARLFMLAGLMAEKADNLAGAYDAMERCLRDALEYGDAHYPAWARFKDDTRARLARLQGVPA